MLPPSGASPWNGTFGRIKRSKYNKNAYRVGSFPNFFLSYCHSIVYRVVSIVSDGCNQSSIAFSYAIFQSGNWCVNVVSDASKSSSPSFLDSYCLTTSSYRYNALYMVISFLVLWSICLSSSLVHLRKHPEYLTSVTAQVFISLIRFLQGSFVARSFLIFQRYSFWILSFISTRSLVSASEIPTLFVCFVFPERSHLVLIR